MYDMKVVKAFNKAIANEDNWKSTGPRWTFVDADVFMDCVPTTPDQIEKHYRLFNDLADMFVGQNQDLTFEEWCAKQARVDAEYKELFGVV